jgi:hypothetical protein
MLIAKILFWCSFGLASIVYAFMVGWSLPAITKAAGGEIPFDLRPFGYTIGEATSFLQALSGEDRLFYLNVQHQLDSIYPALLAISLALGTYLLSPADWRLTPWLGAAFAIFGAGFDYLENYRVARILAWRSETLDPKLVEAASLATIVKSACTTLAMTILLTLLIRWFYIWWKTRRMGNVV